MLNVPNIKYTFIVRPVFLICPTHPWEYQSRRGCSQSRETILFDLKEFPRKEYTIIILHIQSFNLYPRKCNKTSYETFFLVFKQFETHKYITVHMVSKNTITYKNLELIFEVDIRGRKHVSGVRSVFWR